MTIEERLAAMSVSSAPVTDPRTLPGRVLHSLPSSWRESVDRPEDEHFAVFLNRNRLRSRFRNNLTINLTRFIFDHGVEPFELIDHAVSDARRRPEIQQLTTERWPIGVRHSGWAFCTGCYTVDGVELFTAWSYTVYERGNVGYLKHVEATIRDRESSTKRLDLAEAVKTVNFVD